MAGFHSPAVWLGYQAAPSTGGYHTLPWWQAGGDIGEAPVVSRTKGGVGRDAWKNREKLRKQLREQYDRDIDRILANLVIEETIPSEEEGESLVETRLSMPDLSRTFPMVKMDVPGQFERELLIRKVERERAIRKLEEEMTALLVLAHLVE